MKCKKSGKLFKIIKAELELYKKLNIALPRVAPNQRFKDRLDILNTRTLLDRDCSRCHKSLKTTYDQERSKIIYCEDCYLTEIK